MRRCIGLDIHREFAEVAVWEGGTVRSAGRIETTPEGLRLFAARSRPTGSSSPTGRRKPPPQERARVPPLGERL